RRHAQERGIQARPLAGLRRDATRAPARRKPRLKLAPSGTIALPAIPQAHLGGTMIRFIRTALLFLALGLAASAHAQLFRAYLSGSGSDTNPCTLVAPCRLLPAALNAVASGGEIWMLDSANYNSSTVNITKSVSILAIPGVV